MITPEWLADELNLLNTHKALQESILRDIVRRLIKTDFTVTDTAAWQAEKLQQSGMVFDEIMSEVSKLTGKSTEELRAAFARAKTEIFNYGDDEIKKAGFDVKEFKTLSPAMADVMTAAVKKTTTEAKNLTKTTALTSQSAYINAADLAHQQVKSGAFTLDEALANAIRSAADGGFTVIYPSGHKSSLDSAMRRALLTGLNQTTCKIAEMRADEVGGDLMELSAHFGARPSHAEWQGQIVSRSGRRGYLSLDDIGYGKVDGFMGANCRHDWWVFFEGLSKPRYTKRQLNEYKNATVEYDGETMPTYEAMQKQRSMERTVRTLKQRLVAYDEASKNVSADESISAYRAAFDREAKKLKSAEAKIQDFCNQTGIARQKTREQVFAAETVNGAKGFGRSVSGKAVKSFERQKLPNYKSAVIPREKLTNYALNKNHPKGKDKAIAFEKYLGYNIENADMLLNEIKVGLTRNVSTERPSTQYGRPFEVRMEIVGANGKRANIKTGWIIDNGEENPRLTSAYIYRKGGKNEN